MALHSLSEFNPEKICFWNVVLAPTQEVETMFMAVYELVFCKGIILSAYDSAGTFFHELFTPAAALMPSAACNKVAA